MEPIKSKNVSRKMALKLRPLASMARRRNREVDAAGGLAGFVMLLGVLCMVVPAARGILLGIGVIVFGLAMFAGLLALANFLFRRAPSRQGIQIEIRTDSDLTAGEETHDRSSRPRTTEDLLAQLRAIDWFQFEKIVALAYRKLGFTVTRRGGANPDGGIDLLISKDGITWAVQCKQWKTWNVGVKAVRELLGAMTDARVDRGIFVTLCGYTGEAKLLAEKHRIEMLNETGLAGMLESVDAKYDPEVLALLMDGRKFCPRCEREMVLRTAKRGPGVGGKFWGCSSYPRCGYTMPA